MLLFFLGTFLSMSFLGARELGTFLYILERVGTFKYVFGDGTLF